MENPRMPGFRAETALRLVSRVSYRQPRYAVGTPAIRPQFLPNPCKIACDIGYGLCLEAGAPPEVCSIARDVCKAAC
jgi:hypothetical protein